MLLQSVDADGMVPSMLYLSCTSLPLINKGDRKESVPKGGNYFSYGVWVAEMRLHMRDVDQTRQYTSHSQLEVPACHKI